MLASIYNIAFFVMYLTGSREHTHTHNFENPRTGMSGPGVGGGDGNKKRYDQRSRLCCLVTPAMRGTFDVAADMRRRAPRLLPTAEARRVTYRSAVTRCSAGIG